MFRNISEKWKNRPKRKKRISYGRKIRFNWKVIEEINLDYGISRETCFVDENGYLRWKATNHLCHRDIAFEHLYRGGSYPFKFSAYDVHHRDQDKFNNNPGNLKILVREDHEAEHGKVIYVNGNKYIRLVPVDRRRKQTRKAILIGGRRGDWYPRSQLIVRNDYIYATEWIYKKKHSKRV